MSSSELVPLLGEIRDQLKRLADTLQGLTDGSGLVLAVEIGEPTVRVKMVEPPKKRVLLDL
jgi:hypothetical protein